MHAHGVRMSLLQRGGVAPPLHEQGLRDTLVVAPMQSVSLAVQTPAMASTTPQLLHCHILEQEPEHEHEDEDEDEDEDEGMMAQFMTA